MYDKPMAPSHKITHSNFVKTDIRGFGTGVGGFSNCATIIETMKALFTKPEQEPQRAELENRKKLLREIVGAEIDRIKGTAAPVLPSEWKKFVRINEDDDDITKAEKYRHNSMVISKKPYFFRYLYPELNKKYKQYENAYNELSKYMFGIRLKKLLAKPNKTEAEMTLVRRYHKFSPLINSNCTMNILCREFENIDFDIQYDRNNVTVLPDYADEYEINGETLIKIRDLYRKYSSKRSLTYLKMVYRDENEEEYREIRYGMVDAIQEEIREEYRALKLSIKEGLTYIHALSRLYKKFNWAFAWDLLEEGILTCIEEKPAYAAVETERGQEYLGRYYSLKAIPRHQEPDRAILLDLIENDIEELEELNEDEFEFNF